MGEYHGAVLGATNPLQPLGQGACRAAEGQGNAGSGLGMRLVRNEGLKRVALVNLGKPQHQVYPYGRVRLGWISDGRHGLG